MDTAKPQTPSNAAAQTGPPAARLGSGDPSRLGWIRLFFYGGVILSGNLPLAVRLFAAGAALGLGGRLCALACLIFSVPSALWAMDHGESSLTTDLVGILGALLLIIPQIIFLFSRSWDAFGLGTLWGLYLAGDHDRPELRERARRGQYLWPTAVLAALSPLALLFFVLRSVGPAENAWIWALAQLPLAWALTAVFPIELSARALARRIRAVYRPSRRIVVFDGDCGFCMRTVMVLDRLDVLGLLEFADFRRELDSIDSKYRGDLTREQCEKELFYLTVWGRAGGFYGLRSMAWSLPGMWLACPLLYFPGVAPIGVRVYGFVAQNRMSIRLRNADRCHRPET